MEHLPLWCLGKLDGGVCDQIVAEMSNLPVLDAALGVDAKEVDHAIRNTAIRFCPSDYWLNSNFEAFAAQANKECGWDYHLTGSEVIQFAKYGPEQHYGWHIDTFTLTSKPLDRKITVVCLLNDEFEGGQFQVRLYNDYNAPLEKGTVIAFPSILEHRVIPVKSGVRYSATMWIHGPRFR